MFFVPLMLTIAPVVLPEVKRQADAAPDARCQTHQVTKAADTAKPMIHALGAEPPAQALFAVVREVDGCNTPIVLMAQVGQPPIR